MISRSNIICYFHTMYQKYYFCITPYSHRLLWNIRCDDLGSETLKKYNFLVIDVNNVCLKEYLL